MNNIQKILGIITGGAVIASGVYFLNQPSNSDNRDIDYSNTRSNLSNGTADRDCPDFSSQEEAQEFFEEQGGPDEDFHNLDRDGDGIACESI